MSERTSTDGKAHRTAPWPERHRTGQRTRLLLIGIFLLMISMALVPFSGCFRLRSSAGGGQTSFTPPRVIRAADMALPAGYRLEPVVSGLTFPTGVAFDDAGRVYVAEGGELDGGRILRITLAGHITALLTDLPSRGDHHTNGPALGPDGWLYVGVGTYTNAGFIDEDNADFGWLRRYPRLHDLPCRDITLTSENFPSDNPLTPEPNDRAETGAFAPFGTKTVPGRVIRGQVPCSGAVLRVPLHSGAPELVAWGFRNPFGLAFAPDGRLFVTDNSYDVRGSRPQSL